MDDPTQREEAIFNAVLDLPGPFRAAYLKTACGGDAQLLSRVQALFRALGQPIGPDETQVRWRPEEKPPTTDRRPRAD